MGFNIHRTGDADDAGPGVLLWRDGQEEKHLKRSHAVFSSDMFVERTLDALWL
jgi:hypothetical protein